MWRLMSVYVALTLLVATTIAHVIAMAARESLIPFFRPNTITMEHVDEDANAL